MTAVTPPQSRQCPDRAIRHIRVARPSSGLALSGCDGAALPNEKVMNHHECGECELVQISRATPLRVAHHQIAPKHNELSTQRHGKGVGEAWLIKSD